MSETAEITSGDIAAEIKSQSESASPAAQPSAVAETPLASAIETPASTETTRAGEPPQSEWPRIIGNFHDKLEKLAWAKDLTREEVEEALALRRVYKTNPERLVSHLSERVSANAEPKPDVLDENKQPYYSPQQAAKWATWKAEQIVNAKMTEWEQRFGPIEQTFTEQQKVSDANAQIDQAMSWPGFDEYMPDITAAVKAAKARGEEITLEIAYVRAGVPQKIAERSTANLAEEKKKWLAELNSTTERVQDDVNPSRVPAASRKRDEDKTTAEMLREEMDRRKSA